MSEMIEVKVPDIGDYADVPVIDVCVKAGDVVKVDDALVTLESDKATMDVPSSAAGVVKEVRVKLGDKISEGAVVVVIEAAGESAVAAPAQCSGRYGHSCCSCCRCTLRGSGSRSRGRHDRRGHRARYRRLQRCAGDRHLRQGR
jgi:pyruvate/2-oxoglutarate dehydrogenase complex dihydrolipoamide acyltransferase (E2) component